MNKREELVNMRARVDRKMRKINTLEAEGNQSTNHPTYPSTGEWISISHTQWNGIWSQRTQQRHLQKNRQNWRLDLKKNKIESKRQIMYVFCQMNRV